MFAWRSDVFLDAIAVSRPALLAALEPLRAAADARFQGVLERTLPQCESISVDYAVLESREPRDDGGGLVRLGRPRPRGARGRAARSATSGGNVLHGQAVVVDCDGCVVVGEGGASPRHSGLKNTVVVHSAGATLARPLERSARTCGASPRRCARGWQRERPRASGVRCALAMAWLAVAAWGCATTGSSTATAPSPLPGSPPAQSSAPASTSHATSQHAPSPMPGTPVGTTASGGRIVSTSLPAECDRHTAQRRRRGRAADHSRAAVLERARRRAEVRVELGPVSLGRSLGRSRGRRRRGGRGERRPWRCSGLARRPRPLPTRPRPIPRTHPMPMFRFRSPRGPSAIGRRPRCRSAPRPCPHRLRRRSPPLRTPAGASRWRPCRRRSARRSRARRRRIAARRALGGRKGREALQGTQSRLLGLRPRRRAQEARGRRRLLGGVPVPRPAAMTRRLILFEDSHWSDLAPLTDVLPVHALAFGASHLARALDRAVPERVRPRWWGAGSRWRRGARSPGSMASRPDSRDDDAARSTSRPCRDRGSERCSRGRVGRSGARGPSGVRAHAVLPRSRPASATAKPFEDASCGDSGFPRLRSTPG